MNTITLNAVTRTEMGKRTSALRDAALIPGIVYGHDVENVVITVPLVPFGKALAAAAKAVMRAQSPDNIASFGVSHEPPTQATFLQARNCAAVSIEMPPVGQKVMSGNGPAIAFNMPMPPAGTAGNSFSC